jgi:hypothetical protein
MGKVFTRGVENPKGLLPLWSSPEGGPKALRRGKPFSLKEGGKVLELYKLDFVI